MLRRLVGRSLKYLGSLLPLARRARIVAFVLPATRWYQFALFASRYQGRLKTRAGGNGALTEALMLDNWMRALTFFGAYPIPWKPDDMAILDQPRKPGAGILFCWTHVPHCEVPLNALLDSGHPCDFIVAHPGKIVNADEFIVPGLSQRVKSIAADRTTLIRARTALSQGKCVACLADAQIFGPLSPQILQVAGKVGAFVIYQWADRDPDGTFRVTFRPAPYPFCKTDAEIEGNLEFLRIMNHKALAALGALDQMMPAAQATGRHAQRSKEGSSPQPAHL